MTGFRFDCAYCDERVVTDDVDAVKADAEAHLDAHREEMCEVFAVAFGGTDCQNDCGYVFPEDVDEAVGFECPACGHDNFPTFVTQYVYWRIEKTDARDDSVSGSESDDT
ncbi:hypothetical protein M0R88_01690 [Halorussus gelatinilyticus]|uniref:Uncharacterized protein n=1 Tax=Halorussus gelatinilyticus TaxID=2937524 RepID=A0A8U0ILB4_9EURY|nr:hypothetical protein [Halorussus gelatinilyticus]UPW00829.1 hypothetical protein M0R88_01690 [Halorussus gelatinilyticus]